MAKGREHYWQTQKLSQQFWGTERSPELSPLSSQYCLVPHKAPGTPGSTGYRLCPPVPLPITVPIGWSEKSGLGLLCSSDREGDRQGPQQFRSTDAETFMDPVTQLSPALSVWPTAGVLHPPPEPSPESLLLNPPSLTPLLTALFPKSFSHTPSSCTLLLQQPLFSHLSSTLPFLHPQGTLRTTHPSTPSPLGQGLELSPTWVVPLCSGIMGSR